MKHTSVVNKKKSVSDLSKKKQLGFMSCIFVVIGACVGAGIFFKNGSILANTQNSIILSIVCWLVAAAGVIAMALCLAEIVSGQKSQSNLGIAAWVKTFNAKYLYNSCKNFVAYIYTPIILISLAYYFVQALFQGINPTQAPQWWIIMLIALGVLLWFFFTSGLSVRFFNIQNWIIMSVKFIPIIFAFIIGYIYLGTGNAIANPLLPEPPTGPSANTPLFSQLSPAFGVIASIPAIFFAFNGFTFPANLTSDMKEPKKLPLTMTLGLIIVTIIYVGISVSILIASPGGKVEGLQGWLSSHNLSWLYSVIYILIAAGIMSVINGTVVTGVKVYEELIVKHEIFLSHKFDALNKKYNGRPIGGVVYGTILTFIFFALCTVIGLFFANTGGLPAFFDKESQGIFSFVDIVSNWDILFVFTFIGVAILGCLINRKTHKVNVQKTGIFKPAAWVALILLGVSVLYLVVSVFADVGLSVHYAAEGLYSSDVKQTTLSTTFLSAGMLLVYIGVIFIPSWITKVRSAHKR